MKKSLILLLALQFFLPEIKAQKWIDTLYQVQKIENVVYGSDADFAGNLRELKMNIFLPINDTPPSCGRPLLIAVHGGAFLAGNKDADAPPYWAKQFAQRGYTTASVNYRLGMFQTSSLVNCNVSALGVPWNCLNMQDTAEWYRAAYRAQQDLKGAIRFLVKQAQDYQIDPRNVFLVGESAGGITVMQAAFLDDPAEKPIEAGALPDALAPNAIYENQCIQTPSFDTSIASMQLQRPDLGPFGGSLHIGYGYTIKGVGNFYGGLIQDIFSNYAYSQAPRLYMFHQPNDLVVPYDQQAVYQGAAYCFTQWPANCQWIINRPQIKGSRGIRDMINNLSASVTILPLIQFDSTLNTTDCLGQIANPALSGHAIDNIWLRTLNMAQFFAPAIDTSKPCGPNSLANHMTNPISVKVSPNPVIHGCMIESEHAIILCKVYDLTGRKRIQHQANSSTCWLDLSTLRSGIYFLQVETIKGRVNIQIRK
ncbi:MAG: carboxylesterase family protein [Bacteroidetes bacterium]|nr:carboxylesterase family protein [Bacteroidota bacterium]